MNKYELGKFEFKIERKCMINSKQEKQNGDTVLIVETEKSLKTLQNLSKRCHGSNEPHFSCFCKQMYSQHENHIS